MKRTLVTILLALPLFLAGPAGADIYKYLDKDGQQRWTDDLSQVPEEQRAAVHRMKSIEASEANESPEVSQTHLTPVETGHADIAEAADEAMQRERETLEAEQAALDEKYRMLVEERQALEAVQPDTLNDGEQADLAARISAHNEKIKAYESQLNAFNENVALFNRKLTSSAPPPPTE